MLMKEACGQAQREVNGSQAAFNLVIQALKRLKEKHQS